MSLKVKFDRILGRLREADGGDTPTPPVTHTFTATTTGNNKSYFADQQETDSLTVTVTTRYDGDLVDADSVPSGWTRTGLGTYTKTVNGSGTIAAATFTYTPSGGSAMTATSQARTLTKVYPAYWGMVDLGTVPQERIDSIVADLNTQHRETSSFSNRLIDVEGDPKKDMWIWVVTHGSATVVDASFNQNVMQSPVNVTDFASPISGVNIDLSGYKVYVSTWPIEANTPGYQAKLGITL